MRFALVFAAAGFMLNSTPVFARDMHARLGLGYNGQFANRTAENGVPGISIKYGLTRDIAFEAIAGISTTTPSSGVYALKFFKNIFFEDALNFYFMLGGGYVNAAGSGGLELVSGFGSEFFIPGIESLGFAVETGVALHNLQGAFALQTMGVSFLDAGIHFYF